jgi:hypothetical protein
MDLSGQIHFPAALPTGKGQDALWVPEPIWTLWREDKRLGLPGIGVTAHSLVTVPTEQSRFLGISKVLVTLFSNRYLHEECSVWGSNTA